MATRTVSRVEGRLRCYREYERSRRYWKGALPSRSPRQILPGDIDRYIAQREAARIGSRSKCSEPPTQFLTDERDLQ